MRTFDVAVLGVGGMGSAACYRLAKAGLSVLGIEQFDIPHTRGSSHGITRILRLGLHESTVYTQLVLRAVELWNELSAETGQPLFQPVGSLDIAPPGSDVFDGSLAACERWGIDHEVLDASAIRRRYPAIHPDPDMCAVLQPGAGFVLPEQSVITHVGLALEQGVEIHGRETVLSWEERDGCIRLTTDRDTYEAGQLLITAGAWAGKLLAPYGLTVHPERAVLGWFQPLSNPAFFQQGNLPVWIVESPDIGHFYGTPVYGIPGFKLGKLARDTPEMDPAEPLPPANREDEALIRNFLQRYFPEANGPVLSMATCFFENTPDRAFIIDRLPGSDGIWIMGGFSGHGFKYASVMGEIARDLITRGESAFDLSPFSAKRFAS